MLANNKMMKLILCLYITTTAALPSGVYIIDDFIEKRFYNPLTQPHSPLNAGIGFRGDA